MKSQIIAPSIGDNTKACALTRWHKNDSCLVARGDLIATLETKKAILDVEAEHGGYLHHSVHEGMTVGYGEFIGCIEHDGLVSKGESFILMLELSTADLNLIDSSRGDAPEMHLCSIVFVKRLPEAMLILNRRSTTSRVMTTTASRPVSMIFLNHNTNPMIDARRRW